MGDKKIITTQYKSRIPHTVSYPVGTKAISEALSSVPQFPELSVHFSFSTQYTRCHGTSTPYGVIGVQFSSASPPFSASLSIEEQIHRWPIWTIEVHAVPRSLRHVIQNKVQAEALPSIRLWLLANTHSTKRRGVHWLRFRFDELKGELISEEHASVEWQTEKADT